jgi:DNA-binding XRE family transcriptional regulator
VAKELAGLLECAPLMVLTSLSTDDLLLISWTRARCKDGTARIIRQHASLSLAEAGSHLGVSLSTVSKWETANRLPLTEAAITYGHFLRDIVANVP